MVKVQRTRRAEPEFASRRAQDICGLLLFFLGAAGLICLCLSQTAPLPRFSEEALRLMAGKGAYAVPLLLMFAGTMFLIGYERLSLSHSSFGTLLLFLVFVSWRHIFMISSHPEWPGLSGPTQEDLVKEAGGWIGWLFGEPMQKLLGREISHLLLVTLTLVALVLLVDQPFIEILRRIHAHGRAGAQAAQRVGASVGNRGTEMLAQRRDTRAGSRKALEPAVAGERAERAARVVERALTPAAPSPHSAPGDEEEEPTTTGTLFNLFNLTRSWRDREAHAEGNAEAAKAALPVEASKAERNGRPKAEAAAPEELAEKAPGSPATAAPSDPASRPKTGELTILPPFVLPPLTLLKETPPSVSRRSQAELTDRVHTIERTLEQFNIGANVVEVASGPSVTRYEIQLAPGIKVSKIVSLADNLAMSLAAIDVRVEAPIPGKAAIGVEVPNTTAMTVSLRECLDTDEYRNAPSKLTFALGKDVSGQFKYADLAKMPHLLIGGSTNSGKSVCLNALIASLVYRATPREVKLLMLDPKRVELSLWDGIPHLMHPVVKDVRQAAGVFRAALKEMDRRYDAFAALGTRNIDGFNQRVPESERLPYVVLIVDELADLMMQMGPEIETSICRVAQLARATGIHLVIATQRPSVDIITGTIKANISSRIAFAVASQVDSRTILDMTGADRLIGRGDMLFMPIDAAKPVRIQGCYLSENETNALVAYLKDQEKPNYSFTVADTSSSENGSLFPEDEVDDAFFEQAVRLVVNNGQASTSMLQRRFRIGYTRAARIVEMMEERGIVGQLNGAKPREILVSRDEVERMFNPGGSLPSVDSYEDEE
jgi:S-DNA-T family DNA segregation ATPase FtsK/SpoIIIE